MNQMLPSARYEHIKRKVVLTFIKYDVNCVPVNGIELALKMGITVVPYSAIQESKRNLLFKKSNDGFCVEREEGEWFIFYNDRLEYGRVNNTILHEIGHIVLDHTEDSELAEKEVKFFAKYALVPPVLVHKFQVSTPEEIMELFKVSYSAACYALSYYKKWLGRPKWKIAKYELILLMQFRNQKRKEVVALKVENI